MPARAGTRPLAAGATTGPGWTKSGAPRASRRASSGREALDRGGVGERGRGQGDADAAAVEGGVDVGRVGLRPGERHRAPAGELRRQRLDALVVGLDQRRRLLRGQRLDPERGRERDQRPVDPVGGEVGAPQLGVGRLEGEDAVGLGGDPEGPALAAARPARGAAVRRASASIKRLPEEVLVYVDRSGPPLSILD